MVNKKVVTKPSFCLLVGDILTLKKPFARLSVNSFYTKGIKKINRRYAGKKLASRRASKPKRGLNAVRGTLLKKGSQTITSLRRKKMSFFSLLGHKRSHLAAKLIALRGKIIGRKRLKKKAHRFVKGALKRSSDQVRRGILRKGSFFSPYLWVSYARGEIIFGGKPNLNRMFFIPFRFI